MNYPTSEWEKLAEVLETNPSALQSTDRASLLNDAFSLAQSGPLIKDAFWKKNGK